MKHFLASQHSIGAKQIGSAMLLASVFGTVGCVTKRVVLVPATNANLAPQPNSAQGSSQGVSIQLRANAWNDNPKTLDKDLVSMEITIQNESGHPLAIRYENFSS